MIIGHLNTWNDFLTKGGSMCYARSSHRTGRCKPRTYDASCKLQGGA